MRLYSLFFMAGDGSAGSPRRLTTVWPILDQWAILVRDAFTCRDRQGNLLPARVAVLPQEWTLIRDLGPIGIGTFDLDPTVESQALQKFGTSTSVVGTTVAQLRTRTLARRNEILATLPPQAQTAFQQPNWKTLVRNWITGLAPGNARVQEYRTWLVNHLDGQPTTVLPAFMLNLHQADDAIRWNAIADFADFLDNASGANLQVARMTGPIFLQLGWEGA